MATETEPTTTQTPQQPAAPPGTGVGAGPQDGAPANGKGREAPPAQAKGTHPSDVDEQPHDDEGEPKPDDRGWVSMPYRSFLRRLGRTSRAKLKELFGTDDEAAIADWKRESEGLKKDKEDRERAAMSEKEKAEADLKTERTQREAAEKRADEVETRSLAREAGRDVKEAILDAGVDKEWLDVMQNKLKSAIKKNPDEFTKLSHVNAWVKEYVAEHPKMLKDQPKAKDDKPAVKTAPITNGSPGTKKPAAPPSGGEGSELGGKTARPGLPNSMTKDEIAKTYGRRW